MLVAAAGGFEIGDGVDEEMLAPEPAGEAFEPHAGEHGAARLEPLADALHRRPRAEREAAEVVIGQAKVRDQLLEVAAEDAVGVIGRIVRRGALRRGRAGRA